MTPGPIGLTVFLLVAVPALILGLCALAHSAYISVSRHEWGMAVLAASPFVAIIGIALLLAGI